MVNHAKAFTEAKVISFQSVSKFTDSNLVISIAKRFLISDCRPNFSIGFPIFLGRIEVR